MREKRIRIWLQKILSRAPIIDRNRSNIDRWNAKTNLTRRYTEKKAFTISDPRAFTLAPN